MSEKDPAIPQAEAEIEQRVEPSLPEHIRDGLRSEAHGGMNGGCPECGRSTRFVSLLGDNWLVCRDHRTRWCIGNIFDTYDWEWKAWRTIERYLSFFREVKPAYDESLVDWKGLPVVPDESPHEEEEHAKK